MNKLALTVFYCHGLGATARSGIAMQAKKFVESRGLRFESIQYRDSGSIDHVWNVDHWLQDLLLNIDEQSRQQRLSILFGSSAGCHGVLRAALIRPHVVCGLMLLSPGVGLSMQSYVRVVMPHCWDGLMAGKNVLHPAAKDGAPALVNRQCLQHFADTCVSNRMASIPIHCPVRIMHGSKDKIVPLRNVEEFMEKLESDDVILSVMNDMGHHLPMTSKFEELFDSLLHSVQHRTVQQIAI